VRRTILSILALLVVVSPLQAQHSEPDAHDAEQVARAYLAAYNVLDLDTMERFMSEDIVFVDSTNPDPENAPDGTHIRGSAAFVESIRAFVEMMGVTTLGFEWEWIFKSNDRVVLSGWMNALMPAEDPAANFRWRTRQVVVLTIVDGRVVRHEDFIDYENAEEGIVPAGGETRDP